MSAMPKPRPELRPEPILYPESDGKPMADNTKQYRWIQTIEGNIAAMFRDRPDVFVAGDLLWYAVEHFPKIVNAPDVMVVFGRPKHDRGSYLQWLEDDVAPQVVFEILSPSNTPVEMMDKEEWYADRGVQEYYVYDPDRNKFKAFRLEHDWLRPVRFKSEYVSPLLQIRFDLTGAEMVVYYPDGQPFLTLPELNAVHRHEQKLRLDAEKRVDEALKRGDDANQRARRLAELSRKARLGQASAEELTELERLETEASS